MSFLKGIQEALHHGTGAALRGYSANRFECQKGSYGRIIYHYRQGILTNVCHVESGRVWTMPMVFEHRAGEQARSARIFRRTITTLQEEGKL